MKGITAFVSAISVTAMLVGNAAFAQTPVAKPAPAEAPATENQPTDASPQAAEEAREIIVTGTRLATEGFNAPTPVTVLGAEQLAQRAPAAVAETLYEQPLFNNLGPTQSNRPGTTVGFNVLDLRGIGAVRTLVLVDGRRYTPANTTTVFDTNLIPTALVNRTEIVTGGASAAYGSDAVAGVVNFILRDRIEGIDATVQQGISQRGDNQEINVNIAAGQTFGENLNITIGADYSRNKGVGYPGFGFYSREWGQNEYGRMSLPATRAAGLPANILGANIEFANKAPGSLITTGPLRGTTFGPGGQPFQFVYGPLVGTDQMQGSTANFGNTVSGSLPLRTPLERFVVLGRATLDISDATSIFVEGNYGKQIGTGNSAFAQLDNISISINNPFLPAATRQEMLNRGLTSITIGRINREPGPYLNRNSNELLQGTIGARGKIGELSWDAYVAAGRNRYNLETSNVMDVPNIRAALFAVRDPVTNQIVCGPVATNPNLNPAQRAIVSPGCVPFNPFGQGAPSAEAIDYTTNLMFNYVTAKQQVAAINFSISPFELPAGPVALAFGGEYRHNSARSRADARSAVNANFFGNFKPIDGELSVKEGYLEAGVPVLADSPVAYSLDLNGAVRVTDYSNSGTVTTWKLGATYEPIDAIRFRVTRSRDIRAPNIGELFQVGSTGVFQAANPVTGVSGSGQQIARGNPNLKPEIARTWTAGIVLTPESIVPGLRLSADYYDIKIGGAIAVPQPVEILSRCLLNNEPEFCARIILDPASPIGVSTIFLEPANLNSFKARGWDFEIAYRAPLDSLGMPGELNLRALGSHVKQLETFAANGTTFGNQAGGGTSVAGIGGIPKWRWTISANYALDDFFLNLQLRTISRSRFGNGVNFIGPEDEGYSPALPNSISTNRYPAAAYLNLALGWDIVNDGKRKFQFFANVDNVFDKDPPANYVAEINTTFDTIGRTFKVGARLSY